MNGKYFLSIDNGTQSVRAMVFDGQGQLIAKSKIEIEPYFSNQKGWAEQNAEYFWNSLCQACLELWPKLSISKELIAAVSVTTQRATIVPMGIDNQPLRPAITWLDQRQVQTKPKLGKLESVIMGIIGAKPLVDLMHAEAEANWIQQNEPEIWKQVHKFLLLSGYHNYKLTGQYNDAIASTVGFVPFEYKTQRWAEQKDWKWRAMSILPEMLPEVLPAGSVLGEITEAAAEETGIPKGDVVADVWTPVPSDLSFLPLPPPQPPFCPFPTAGFPLPSYDPPRPPPIAVRTYVPPASLICVSPPVIAAT